MRRLPRLLAEELDDQGRDRGGGAGALVVQVDDHRVAGLRRVAQAALRPFLALGVAVVELLDAVEGALLHGERDERVFLAGGVEEWFGLGLQEIEAPGGRDGGKRREGVAALR